MNQPTQAIRTWTDRYIRRHIVPMTNREEQATSIETIMSLYGRPVIHLSNPQHIAKLWETIHTSPLLADFVVHGTTYMELHGFTGVAHRNKIIRHVSDALRWITMSAHTSEEFKKSGYKSNEASGTDQTLMTDPWLIFLAIFQTLELDFTLLSTAGTP